MFTLQQLLKALPHWRTVVPPGTHKVLSLIERCHTAALGYHHYQCTDPACAHVHYLYHSCRNRHCPHCGADDSNQWKPLKKGFGDFLFPYPVMEPLFKGYFLEHLSRMISQAMVKLPQNTDWKKLKNLLHEKRWIIHAKKPFGGPAQIVEYLARYTHKTAISNHRIKNIDEQNRVTFFYKDYADNRKVKTMTLSGEEFLKRFTQHILPRGFVRIRHYGILGNNKRKKRVAAILEKMNLPLHPAPVKTPLAIKLLSMYGKDIALCPKCGKAKLVLVSVCYPVSTPLNNNPIRAGPIAA